MKGPNPTKPMQTSISDGRLGQPIRSEAELWRERGFNFQAWGANSFFKINCLLFPSNASKSLRFAIMERQTTGVGRGH